MKIDHVTIAGTNLQTLQDAFESANMAAVYGGPHSNGVTHMALLGLDDGSYIELISKQQPDKVSPWWDKAITEDAGPCAWSQESEDIHAEVERLKFHGVSVDGPTYYQRERPDGKVVEWDLAVIGEDGMGAVHPFIIQDRTPRNYRVTPSPSVSGSELTGIELVIIAVHDMEKISELFQRIYHFKPPKLIHSSHLQADIAIFPGQPLALASAHTRASPLTERLKSFGDSPCAFLIGTTDMATSKQRFGISHQEQSDKTKLAWFTAEGMNKTGLGLISR